MPVYTFSQTVLANTSFNDAVPVKLKLCPGILTEAIINIPAGVMFLARFQILDGLLNVLPGRDDQYYTGEGSAEKVAIWHELKKEPFELIWKLWNIDDTHKHEIVMKLTVLPEEVATNLKAIRELTKEVQVLQNILSGEKPGPLTALQLDLEKFIRLLPGEQTAQAAPATTTKKVGK